MRVPMVDNLKDYPHSSLSFYINPNSEPQSYMDISLLPLCMPPSYEKTTAGYSSYCLQTLGKEKIDKCRNG